MAESQILSEVKCVEKYSSDFFVKFVKQVDSKELSKRNGDNPFSFQQNEFIEQDNIYNKVNILLVVCMAIFIAQAESFNGNALVKSIMSANTEIKVICLIMQLCFSAIALLLILGATVLLCLLLKSQKMPVLNCLDIRNQNVNEYKLENEANTLLVLYTNVIAEMNPIIEKKQKRYDLSVILVATSVVLFAIEKIM